MFWKHEDNSDKNVSRRLEALRAMPPRNEQKAAAGRANYLAQVKAASAQKARVAAVPETPRRRLNEWINAIGTPLIRKERFKMIPVIASLIVAFTLVFGGAGATVYAAQDSNPTDFLYPVKTFSEDVQLAFTTDPKARVDLLMEFADRRVDEIVTINAAGEPLPAALVDRLEKHLALSMQSAIDLQDAEMMEALAYIGLHVRKQDRLVGQNRTNMPEFADPAMEEVQALLRRQIGLADTGVTDPAAFRNQLHRPEDVVGQPPAPGGGVISDTQVISGTVTPMFNGFGPGPGPGPENQGEIVQPTEGYGPGPGPQGTPQCDVCDPNQNGNPAGPMATPQPGGNGGGGSGSKK
jgi:hypothetical protein